MRFPSTRRERGGGKKERRESTRTRTHRNARAPSIRARVCMRSRVCTRALHGAFAPGGNARTCRGNRERLGRGTKTERERGEAGERQGDGSCVCTTRRVYQATSVVTAIVPTTSPAGRYPRSIRLPFRRALPSLWRRVGFPPSPLIHGSPWCVFFRFLPPHREGRDPTLLPSSSFSRASLPQVSCFASFLLPISDARSVFTSGRKVNF